MSVKAISSFPIPISAKGPGAKPAPSVLSPAQKRLRSALQTQGRNGTLSPEADRFFGAAFAAATQVYGPKLAPRIFFRLFPDAFIFGLLESMLASRAATMKQFFDSWGESLRMNNELDRKSAEKSQDDRRHLLATATARKAAADAVFRAAQTAAQIAPVAHPVSGQGTRKVNKTSRATSAGETRDVSETKELNQEGAAVNVTTTSPALLSHVATLQALDLPADDIGPSLGSPKDRERQHNAKPLK